METYILLENNSIDSKLKTKHGLSVLINHRGKNILLDVGPDRKFIQNAQKMDLDLTKVELLFLSHAHYDHTRGLNDFFKINNSAVVYLMDDINSRYCKKFGLFNIPLGLKLHNRHSSKITQIKDDLIIDSSICFLKNSVFKYQKPASNKSLLKIENRRIIPDTFDHEGILVFEDNNELVIFNSCSHNGLLNIIETVETKIPDKKIRAYVGGLHLSNPSTKEHESNEYLDMLTRNLSQKDINIYTGHCTGTYALNYLKEKLKDKIHEINTGMKLNI